MVTNPKRKIINLFFTLLGASVLLAVWWGFAKSSLGRFGVIPTPPEAFGIIGKELQKDYFWQAVLATLKKSFWSFSVSFLSACAFAFLAHWQEAVGKLLNPFIVMARAMPTMALVLILLLTVGSNMLPIAVAFLVVFPLCYENMYTAIAGVDKKLLMMSRVFKVPVWRQITEIYIPSILPYVFSSVIAGFGLNIKVVISAEVLGLPSMSIGYLIMAARQGFDFSIAFAWLVIAVILSLICETVLKIIRRICMPYKYPDLKIIKTILKKTIGRWEAVK